MGSVAQGDRVMVVRSMNDMRRRPSNECYIPATVTKAARVWLELEEVTPVGRYPRTWRMRRDTQKDGSQYPGSSERFVTMDQYRAEVAQHEARAFLSGQGITVEHSSPWRGREVELANILHKHGLVAPA